MSSIPRLLASLLILTLQASRLLAEAPRVVFLIGEDEYKTWETLPEFAKTELEPRGFRCTIITEDPKDKNHFPGLVEALPKADLLVLSTRRRLPPKAQLDAVRAFLASGKPLVGLRTACHAFAPPLKEKTLPLGADAWPEFDPQVLGGHYVGHHGASPQVAIAPAPGADASPLLKGVEIGSLIGKGSLYKVNPLDPTCVPLLIGSIPGNPPEPVAWTRSYGPKMGRVFYTSLGHPDDFQEPAFRRLLLNGIEWALDRHEAAPVKRPATRPATPAKPAVEIPLPRSETVPSLRVAADLRVDEVLREPVVANPLYINFDERGRMWVVQYRQYPWPAGLKMRSRDAVWRNVYDPPFPPPPPFTGDRAKFRGRDRITIHESTRGDGVFDKTTVFLDGLNLATAALKGRGGVFVLNPPYLLFYRCTGDADAPDTDTPEVLLSGFGIEDTHALANDLRWGPDGWIYGAQGSTVSMAIVRHGADGKPVPNEAPVRAMGQNIWRYHPESRRFEIFAEGGGNAFGVEIDAKGRIFSGHNGGDTRGFHYAQGGYFQKGFDKHGALSNPYAFGYIRPMEHPRVDRFTHAFTFYEGGALPSHYDGKLIAIAPHRHYVVESEATAAGSTFRTSDVAKMLTAGDEPRDDWFTPVDVQQGPDGALYVADWYSIQANHFRASEGQTNPDLGRVYRLTGRDAKPGPVVDLGRVSSDELVRGYVGHPGRWARQQALRLLGDRKDRSVIEPLKRMVREAGGQPALDAFWALNLSGGFDDASAAEALAHRDPHVRRWAVRLLGDANRVTTELAATLAALAATEQDPEVRNQLACTARRLPAPECLPIVAALLRHDEDAADPQIPLLLWWALEAHAGDRAAALEAMRDPAVWNSRLRPEGRSLSSNLMQRWATAGTQEDLIACARLLDLSPSSEHTAALAAAFQRAFEGRPVPPLPDALAEALAKAGGPYATLLGVRRGDDSAIDAAFEALAAPKTSTADRVRFIRALGDVRARPAETVPAFLGILERSKDDAVRVAASAALQKFDEPSIGVRVVKTFGALPLEVRPTAESLLASRAPWAMELMRAVDSGAIPARAVHADTIEKLRLYPDAGLAKLVALHFPDAANTKREFEEKIARYKKIVAAGGGNPLAGREVFNAKAGCAACHTVFDEGGHIGPDLTSYDRRNLDAMLLAVVNPSAEIREGFENYVVVTTDGRTLDGFKVDEDGKVFVLRGTDGQNNAVPIEQIKTRRVSPKSLMPEGLLEGLSETEVRDLFAFLGSTTPPK